MPLQIDFSKLPPHSREDMIERVVARQALHIAMLAQMYGRLSPTDCDEARDIFETWDKWLRLERTKDTPFDSGI